MQTLLRANADVNIATSDVSDVNLYGCVKVSGKVREAIQLLGIIVTINAVNKVVANQMQCS